MGELDAQTVLSASTVIEGERRKQCGQIDKSGSQATEQWRVENTEDNKVRHLLEQGNQFFPLGSTTLNSFNMWTSLRRVKQLFRLRSFPERAVTELW